MTRRRVLLTLVAALVVLAVAGSELVRRASPEIAWRHAVLREKLQGELPAIPFMDLARWIRPGSAVYLAALADNPNPHAAIHNAMTQAENVEHGRDAFRQHCATCHGSDARGNTGPSLIDAVATKSDWSFFSTAKWGREGTAMAPQPLDDAAIWEVHAYVRQLALSQRGNAPASTGEGRLRVDVAPRQILEADAHPDQWLTYAGNVQGHRHSSLKEVNKSTVADLRIAWVAQLRQADRELQVSPLVANGVMYVTESGEAVIALDAASGEVLWTFRRQVSARLSLCCGTPNRGVAVLGTTVYFATIDAHLVALDANTGRMRWDVQVVDYRDGYSMTSAPLAIPGRIIVGVAGGEFGARGLLAAFDPDQGRLLWRFDTVPGPGEFGHDTWAGDSWKTGGAPTPTTGAYDAKQDLLIWGTGNPSPAFRADVRQGDNLFSSSVVAVNASTGKLAWYYQFTPHDEHDWDSNQQPILADLPWDGRLRPLVLWANRNGFYYVLDRTDGAFLLGKPYVKQTWNEGFDAKGRPRSADSARPSTNGTVVWPAIMAATNWWPPSFDGERKLVFVPSSDAAGMFFRNDNLTYERGERFEAGAGTPYAANLPAIATVKAIDATTGAIRWQAQVGTGPDSFVWTVGGVLSTAGGVAFAGYRDRFYAFDSDTGRELWKISLGSRVRGSPISYTVNGRERVAVAAGSCVFVFALPER